MMQGQAPARKGDWIKTISGIEFYPLDPRASEILVEDVAHALSHLCRFGGHVKQFYSVAEHVVRVSNICPNYPMWGLHHDDSEAYMVDLPRPIKRHSQMGELYRGHERILLIEVCKAFNLPYDLNHVELHPHEVELADGILLATEKRDLVGKCYKQWEKLGEPLKEVIKPMAPQEAKIAYLNRHYYLLSKGMLQ